MFYTFDQNNPGGIFVIDDTSAVHVIIEADSASEANQIAKELGLYFHGSSLGIDCVLGGNRWEELWDGEIGTETPNIFGTEISEYACPWTPRGLTYCRVFFKSGEVDEYFLEERRIKPMLELIYSDGEKLVKTLH